MSSIRSSSSLPDAKIVRAKSTCLSLRLRSPLSASSRARMSSELSGVRSSWDMFARNSDLYFEESASCSAFSSIARRAISISRFLTSMRSFWSASSAIFSASSALVLCSSSCRLCSSWVSDCDCSSSSSVRMLATMALMTMPIVSASCSRNVRCTSSNGANEASSITPSTWSSKSTGWIRMLLGAAPPRPELISM